MPILQKTSKKTNIPFGYKCKELAYYELNWILEEKEEKKYEKKAKKGVDNEIWVWYYKRALAKKERK